MLAQRRLTEAQLWSRLERRGYEHEAIAGAVESVKRDGFLDDALFARLFVDGRIKAVGNARLVAELVKRGIERDAAKASVSSAERSESDRLTAATEKLFRSRTTLSYPSAARALERLGFPASSIYRHLRAHLQESVVDTMESEPSLYGRAEDSP
jgi:regulatory protein